MTATTKRQTSGTDGCEREPAALQRLAAVVVKGSEVETAKAQL